MRVNDCKAWNLAKESLLTDLGEAFSQHGTVDVNLNNGCEVPGKQDLAYHMDPGPGTDKHMFKFYGEHWLKERRSNGVAYAEVRKDPMKIRGSEDEILGLNCPKEIYCCKHDSVANHSQVNVDKNSATIIVRMSKEKISVNESFDILHRVLSYWALKSPENLKKIFFHHLH